MRRPATLSISLSLSRARACFTPPPPSLRPPLTFPPRVSRLFLPPLATNPHHHHASPFTPHHPHHPHHSSSSVSLDSCRRTLLFPPPPSVSPPSAPPSAPPPSLSPIGPLRCFVRFAGCPGGSHGEEHRTAAPFPNEEDKEDDDDDEDDEDDKDDNDVEDEEDEDEDSCTVSFAGTSGGRSPLGPPLPPDPPPHPPPDPPPDPPPHAAPTEAPAPGAIAESGTIPAAVAAVTAALLCPALVALPAVPTVPAFPATPAIPAIPAPASFDESRDGARRRSKPGEGDEEIAEDGAALYGTSDDAHVPPVALLTLHALSALAGSSAAGCGGAPCPRFLLR
jgi:hypothetical protein